MQSLGPFRSRFCLISIVLMASCAVPGQLYLVVPAISGTLHGGEPASDGDVMTLTVIHRESPDLFERRTVPLAPSRSFRIEPVELVIAGHEYSKHYRLFLSLQRAGRSRTLWRAEISRRQIAGPIDLDCDLDRPQAQGQPCWVIEPLLHPWLVAAGKRTFDELCAVCHGNAGKGDESSADALVNAPPNLQEIASRRGGRFDRGEIAEWIEGRSLPLAHGTRVMPVWGDRLSIEYERYADGDELIGPTLDPILAYLESLQTTGRSLGSDEPR